MSQESEHLFLTQAIDKIRRGWGVMLYCLVKWLRANPKHKFRSHPPNSSIPQSWLIYDKNSLCDSTEKPCSKQWCYICVEELLLVCEIRLSIMWKAKFLTQRLHTDTTGMQQCVLFNQNGFLSDWILLKYIPHLPTACSLCVHPN